MTQNEKSRSTSAALALWTHVQLASDHVDAKGLGILIRAETEENAFSWPVITSTPRTSHGFSSEQIRAEPAFLPCHPGNTFT